MPYPPSYRKVNPADQPILRIALPLGISFFGTAFSEPTLIRLASGFEAATEVRAHNLPTFAAMEIAFLGYKVIYAEYAAAVVLAIALGLAITFFFLERDLGPALGILDFERAVKLAERASGHAREPADAPADGAPSATRNDTQLARRFFHLANGVAIATAYALFFTHEQVVRIFGAIACVVYIIDRLRIAYPETVARHAPWVNHTLVREGGGCAVPAARSRSQATSPICGSSRA